MKYIFWFLFLSAPFLVLAQSDYVKGIKWTRNLSWEEIRAKAKSENKYIFLDCFTTWCAPCKRMDELVFSKLRVGEFINDKLISVKVQMDQTGKDNDFIKSWYKDAAEIMKQFKVTAFPTYLFFTPAGVIVHKERGYKIPEQFIDIAKVAITPGRKYVDPYKEFDAFVVNYESGKKNYRKMPAMIKKAQELNDRKLVERLSNDYLKYLEGLGRAKWYEKSNIECVASNLINSNSSFFSLFYNESKQIDDIMNKQGFSKKVVDRIIEHEITNPFLNRFYKNVAPEQLVKQKVEPHWDSLFNIIAAMYNQDYADRGVRSAKTTFYHFVGRKSDYIISLISHMSNGDFDVQNDVALINACSWYIFEGSVESKEIFMAIQWMEKLIAGQYFDQYNVLDTYAQLLYKVSMMFNANRFEEALKWEKKALERVIVLEKEFAVKNFTQVIEKMNKREVTWK